MESKHGERGGGGAAFVARDGESLQANLRGVDDALLLGGGGLRGAGVRGNGREGVLRLVVGLDGLVGLDGDRVELLLRLRNRRGGRASTAKALETGSRLTSTADDRAKTPTDAKRRNGKAEPFSLDRLPG